MLTAEVEWEEPSSNSRTLLLVLVFTVPVHILSGFYFRKQKYVVSMRLRLSWLDILVVTKKQCDSSKGDGTSPAPQTGEQTFEADSLEECILDYADLKTRTINIAFWLWHSSYQLRMIHEKSMQIRHRLPKHVIRNSLPKGMSQAGE